MTPEETAVAEKNKESDIYPLPLKVQDFSEN
jgi:hypothetical protein